MQYTLTCIHTSTTSGTLPCLQVSDIPHLLLVWILQYTSHLIAKTLSQQVKGAPVTHSLIHLEKSPCVSICIVLDVLCLTRTASVSLSWLQECTVLTDLQTKCYMTCCRSGPSSAMTSLGRVRLGIWSEQHATACVLCGLVQLGQTALQMCIQTCSLSCMRMQSSMQI